MKNKIQFLIAFAVFLSIRIVSAQNFTISSGTQFVTSGSPIITVTGGTFTNNGVITATDASFAFKGAVTYNGSGTTITKNLIIDHSGTSLLNNKIKVTEALTVSNGILNANNNLTLVSNATGSAIIAPIPFGSNIIGDVTVERYIQGKRAFRFLSPGVTTSNYIINNWQADTYITGSTSGANGFDQSVSGGPSMFVYNNDQVTGSGWAAIPNTDATNLEAMKGYRILIRGDRTATLLTQASQANMNVPITVKATGTVKTGTVVFNSSSTPPINATNNTTTDGYSLVGNPYVNTVNWDELTKTGLTDTYYTWDVEIGSASERGRVIAYNTSTLSSNPSNSSVNNYIQPGQAFFIKNTTVGTPGTLTFTEDNKKGTNINNNFFRTTSTNLARLELQAYETSVLASGGNPLDAAVSVFNNQFTNAYDNGDAMKLSTGYENLSFLNNNIELAIDARPQVSSTDELLVQLLWFKPNKNYSFKTIFSNFDVTSTPFLLDTYLNQYTPLANDASSSVAFTTTSDPASYNLNRFKIVFQNTTLSTSNFNATHVTVYPNPIVENVFTITLPTFITGEVGVKLINTLGQKVYELKTNAQNLIVIKPNQILANGMYLLQISNQGTTITKKIIIQ